VFLTAKKVRGLTAPGKYSDGHGLILHVITTERRNWIYRYMRAGKDRSMGLGSAALVSLEEARQKAHEARKLLAEGVDPIDARQAAQAAAEAAQAARVSFAEAAAMFIAGHEAGWRNPKHRQQWRNTLDTYAAPVIGAIPVTDIDPNMVLRVLQPIWTTKPETASRVRSRIEQVLDYCTARGWRTGTNPAIWRGNLKLMLPATAKVRAVKHHAALDWRLAPAFVAALRERDGMGALALEFAILTAARSGEVRGARWSEIDLDRAIWTLPAARMKGGREHRVPLTESALAILTAQAEVRDDSGLIFHGHRHGTPMSDMTLTAVLRRMGRGDLTAHGFRSTFRDWCADNGKSADIAEAALAHAIGDKTVAAYHRTDLFDPRRKLMADWAAYLAKPEAEVVTLRAA
jgi:integrase